MQQVLQQVVRSEQMGPAVSRRQEAASKSGKLKKAEKFADILEAVGEEKNGLRETVDGLKPVSDDRPRKKGQGKLDTKA